MPEMFIDGRWQFVEGRRMQVGDIINAREPGEKREVMRVTEVREPNAATLPVPYCIVEPCDDPAPVFGFNVIGLRVGSIERLIEVERDGAFVEATPADLGPGVRFRSLRMRVDDVVGSEPLENGRIYTAIADAETDGEICGVRVVPN